MPQIFYYEHRLPPASKKTEFNCIIKLIYYNQESQRWLRAALASDSSLQGNTSYPSQSILYLFTCNLNAEKMLEIYKKALLPSAERWFIDKNKDWVLHEDNDSKHRSKLCTEWKQQSGIVTLDWPSQLPDANPIENVLA